MKKKIYTKKKFEKVLEHQAYKMSKDKKLIMSAYKVIERADKYMYIHQTKFLGETSLNLPEDLFLIQNAIYETHFVIEIGFGLGWHWSIYCINSR